MSHTSRAVCTDLVPVPVPGADVPMQAALVGGEPFVALKPMCEAIGVDVDGQRRRLDQAKWARTELISVRDSAGRTQRMIGLHADCIPMWLATISSNKVAPEARAVLVTYQREAARALRDYFYRGVAVQAASMNELDVLRGALDQIEAAKSEAAEAKALAERTDARLAAIEGKHDWLSALAYARINQLQTHTAFLRRLGACATRVAKSHGIEPNQVQHQRYGKVNSYPVWVWDLAAERLRG